MATAPELQKLAAKRKGKMWRRHATGRHGARPAVIRDDGVAPSRLPRAYRSGRRWYSRCTPLCHDDEKGPRCSHCEGAPRTSKYYAKGGSTDSWGRGGSSYGGRG